MKRALLIGINYVGTNMELKGCIDDVVNIQKMLMEEYDYLPENIKVLRDDDITVADNFPTRTNILKEIENLINAKDSSEIWFYYSGHGSQIPESFTYSYDAANPTDNLEQAPHWSSVSNPRWYKLDDIIIPVNYQTDGYITDIELFALICRLQCPTILIFDCCHSGTLCDLPWTFCIEKDSSVKNTNDLSKDNSFNILECTPLLEIHSNNPSYNIPNEHIYMFSAGRDEENSIDTYDTVHKQAAGAFTIDFIAVLEEANYTMTLLELFKRICLRFSQRELAQHPTFSSSSKNPNYKLQRTMKQMET